MIITKSPNHKNFSCKDRKIYETLSTGETKLVRELDFHFPNNENLPQGGIDYLNKHYEYYNKTAPKPEPPPQLELGLFG